MKRHQQYWPRELTKEWGWTQKEHDDRSRRRRLFLTGDYSEQEVHDPPGWMIAPPKPPGSPREVQQERAQEAPHVPQEQERAPAPNRKQRSPLKEFFHRLFG